MQKIHGLVVVYSETHMGRTFFIFRRLRLGWSGILIAIVVIIVQLAFTAVKDILESITTTGSGSMGDLRIINKIMS